MAKKKQRKRRRPSKKLLIVTCQEAFTLWLSWQVPDWLKGRLKDPEKIVEKAFKYNREH